MSSPTSRSLALLRKMGYHVDVVEQWNPHTKTRMDLYGFIDIHAVHPAHGFLFVQATSASNATARCRKIEMAPAAPSCVLSGAKVEVWGWSQQGKAGKRKVWKVNRYRAKLVAGLPECEAMVGMSRVREET